MSTGGSRYLSFKPKKLFKEVGLTGTPVTEIKEGSAKQGGTAED